MKWFSTQKATAARLSRRPLPPYAFVPTHFPHPVRDPAGHSHKHEVEWGPAPTQQTFSEHEGWRFSQDLFNHGFYWEAHEGFETWWRSLEEGNPRRCLFQGLLRLCAAGVKARQGMAPGVHSHATRATQLLAEAQASLGPRCLGLDLPDLIKQAQRLALKAHTFPQRSTVPKAEVILDLSLLSRG